MQREEDSVLLPELPEGTFWFDTMDGLLPPDETALTAPLPAQTSDLPPEADCPADDDHATSSGGDSWQEPPRRARRGRGRGRGRGRSAADAEEKRLKNREIQARYRARQKAMRDELEEAHERLATDLEREQAHNEVYKQENAVMERVLVFRDTSISILQKRGGGGNVSEDEAAPTAMTSSSGELLRSESSRRSSLPQPVVQSVYTRLSSDLGAPIRSVSDAYHAVERLTDDQGNLMDTDPHFSLVAATAKELTGAELIQAWHEFALSLQDILEEAEADAAKRGDSLEDYDYLNPPYPLNKCVPIFQELVLLLGSALRHNLPAVQELFATTSNINCADGSVEAAWQRIAQAMKISSAQRIKVLGHWTGYQAKMRALEKERQQAAQSLAAVAAGTGPITSLQRMMEEYLLLFDSSSKVSAAPNGELLAMLELMRHTGHVFTMLQKVRMVVMAYPAYPDIVQLMRAIAAMREPVESGALMSTQDASAQLREAGGAVE